MPIHFSVWIDGVVGSARIIADKETLRRVWIEGDKTITSMIDFDESYEQLFGDLDALAYLPLHTDNLNLSVAQKKATREYIEAFHEFDDGPFIKGGILDVKAMLQSAKWRELETKAQNLVSLF